MGNSRNRKDNENTPEQPTDKGIKAKRLGSIVLPDAFTTLFGTPLVGSQMERLISIDKMPVDDDDKLENPTYDRIVQQLGSNPLAQ